MIIRNKVWLLILSDTRVRISSKKSNWINKPILQIKIDISKTRNIKNTWNKDEDTKSSKLIIESYLIATPNR